METAGIVAFAFGTPKHIYPNQVIGRIASFRAIDLHAPVYTQLDVPVFSGIRTTYTEEDPGNPPPTLRIARGAARWAEALGMTELWISAAKPHAARCVRDLRAAIAELGIRIKVSVCAEVDHCSPEAWFSEESEQPRTRAKSAWLKRECILMLMPFSIYKCVAR